MLPVLGGLNLHNPLLSPHNPKAPQPQRDITFFFAGGICGWMDRGGGCTDDERFNDTKMAYSAGVRQKVG